MKSKIIYILIALIITVQVAYGEQSDFTDTENHWGVEWIQNLVDYKITSGFPDGTFRPDSTVSVEQFITFTIKALQNIDQMTYQITTTGTYWSDPYIEKAIVLEIITQTMFEDYRRPITREEMAYVLISAFSKHNPLSQPHINMQIRSMLYDYYQIDPKYIDYFLYAVRDGFITGKGKHGENVIVDPKGNATRAEASVLIVKLLEENKREIFLKEVPTMTMEYIYEDGGEYIDRELLIYAPTNAKGELITEHFDIFKQLNPFDDLKYPNNSEDVDFNVSSSYIHYSNEALFLTVSNIKHKEQYEKDGRIYWDIERVDLTYSFYEEKTDTIKVHTLHFSTDFWCTVDYDSNVAYFEGEYGKYIDIIFSRLFGDEAGFAKAEFYKQIEADNKWYEINMIINNRQVSFDGHYVYIEAKGE